MPVVSGRDYHLAARAAFTMTAVAMRGRVLAYARYQLTDFLVFRTLTPLLLVGLLAGLHVFFVTRNITPEMAKAGRYIEEMKHIYATEITIFLPLCAFLGAVMVASADRHLGHFRFFFSKPVSVRRFYVQAYAVHGLAFAAVFGLVTFWFEQRTLVHQSVLAGMGAAAISFVLFGGLGLLLGNFWQLDALLLPVTYSAGLMLQLILAGTPDAFSPAVRVIARSLPPAVYLDSVHTHLYAGTAMNPGQFWHVFLYGAGAFAIGALIIHRAPLSQ
jgi:hypothetical protein